MSILPLVVDGAQPPCALVLQQEQGSYATWLQVSGELDLATAPQLEQTLEAAHRVSGLVVLEPLGLTFIDCAGLGVIVDAASRARGRRGWLLLVASSTVLERLLTRTGTQDLVTVFDAHSGPDTFGRRERRPLPLAAPSPEAGAKPAPKLGRLGRLRAVRDNAEAAPPSSGVRKPAWPRPSPGRGHATNLRMPD